jgi:uncharacterized damage-inducible protein DinB
MAATAGSGEVRLLVDLVDEAFDHHAWHGTTLRGSLRGLDQDEVSWRPGEDRHNIWEIAVHAAYWKYAVWRRLVGERRGSFPLPGSNWFPRPDPGLARTWREDLGLLLSTHAQLRHAVAQLTPRKLGEPGKGRFTVGAVVRGIASHDLYHAGQIQLVRRLMPR